MISPTKRDLSVSLKRANIIVFLVGIPLAIFMFWLFSYLHNAEKMELTWNTFVFLLIIVFGVIVHELIHGIGWALFGKKPFSAIKFGILWHVLTPYAHLTVPIEVNAYRIGAFLPGLIVGIIPYAFSPILGNGNLFWFGLLHTIAAGGDWIVLWKIRNLQPGTLVEDHSTRAGCYIIEEKSSEE
ncbi:MAG: DUF3267 domain-containing protein [Anaerolineales bacterium]|nr:DUF3267 domain-containing protein [Anaerolineales bacterium]